MSEPCGAESLSVVVNHHGTEDDFIASVPVNISNGEVVETIAKPRSRSGIPTPELSQLVSLRINVQRTHLVLAVTATSKEDAGFAPIKIRGTEIVLGRTVSCVVFTPNGGIVTFIAFETGKRVCHRGVCR